MGLIKCKDCGHKVSEQAAACPNCGRPPLAPASRTSSGGGGGGLLLLVAIGIGVYILATNNSQEAQVEKTYNFDWGGVFTGVVEDGRVRRGKLILPDATVIEGDWTISQGTITYPDGRLYTGEWNGDPLDGSPRVGPWWVERPHGQGKMVWPDGRVQEGVWENGALRPDAGSD